MKAVMVGPFGLGPHGTMSRLGWDARQRVMEEFAWHKLAVVAERAYSG